MIYRVVYKKYHELSQAIALVEEDVEAAGFNVKDGNLVFYADRTDGTPMRAIPMGAWLGVEPVVQQSSLIT